jgi:hypothetical protein
MKWRKRKSQAVNTNGTKPACFNSNGSVTPASFEEAIDIEVEDSD